MDYYSEDTNISDTMYENSLKRVVVTGALGFIGSTLCKTLDHFGYNVYPADIIPVTGSRKGIYKDRQEALSKRNIHVSDVNSLAFAQAVKEADVVIHLGAMANPRTSMSSYDIQYEYIQNNVINTMELIEMTANKGTHLLYASSSSVNPKPLSLYALTKLNNEWLFEHNASQHKKRIGMRFHSVYGPWGRPDMAIYGFTNKLLNGDKILLHGDGKLTRDYTYIADCVTGIMMLLDKAYEKEENDNYHKVYNIGSGYSISNKALLTLLADKLGVEPNYELISDYTGEAEHTLSDNTDIKELGYEPKTTLYEGLDHFINWYKGYNNTAEGKSS